MIKIYDIISPGVSLDPESLGSTSILILSENTLLPTQFGSQFKLLSDFENFEEGKYYRRVGNDLERGLLIGKLLEKFENATLFSQRPDVLKKYMPNCEVNLLEIRKEELNPNSHPQFFRPENYAFSMLDCEIANQGLINPLGIEVPAIKNFYQKSPAVRQMQKSYNLEPGVHEQDLLNERPESNFGCDSLFSNTLDFPKPYYQAVPKSHSITSSRLSSASTVSKHQKSRDLYTEIYKDVLEKYADKFLKVPEIRAAKSKSAKAQIRNLADGSIISYRKKYSADEIPSSQEITDLIYEDLIAHGCIDETGLSVEYHDAELSQYFGRRKHKEFICGLSRQDNPQPALTNNITNVFTTLSKNLYNYSVSILHAKDKPKNLGDLTKRMSDFLQEETEKLKLVNPYVPVELEKKILISRTLEDMIRNKKMNISADGDVIPIIRNYSFFGYMDIQSV